MLEGDILPRVRKIEGRIGEFSGSYSGARLQGEIKIHTVTHRTNPVFENLYLGIPWTEIDYLLALNTSIPLYRQIKEDFPEVVAVNAMYTHGIGVIVSTKSRYGGYGKAVLSPTPGLRWEPHRSERTQVGGQDGGMPR